MKRVFCPKCDNQVTFDEKKYPSGESIALVCPQCGGQFNVRPIKKATPETGNKKADIPCGSITIIENSFAYKQEFPLFLGDNVIGRRNKGTEVEIPIITSDPSMARQHCAIHVKQNKRGKFIYTLRDYASMTGTFLRSECLKDRELVQIGEGAVITIGATTFILHTVDGEEEDGIE